MMENWGDGSFGERLAHSMGEQAAHIEQFGYCSCRGHKVTTIKQLWRRYYYEKALAADFEVGVQILKWAYPRVWFPRASLKLLKWLERRLLLQVEKR